MEVEKIAQKLEPLMPEQVKCWIRARDLADADLRGLIDKQIISTAYSVLGDFRKKALLSLPSEQKAKGALNLGAVIYEEEKWHFGISFSELLQNMAIFGRSGAGKTNIAFHILLQLEEKSIPFLFLDWKRTARHLLPHFKNRVRIATPGRTLASFEFNPFTIPPGIEEQVYANLVIDVLADAFTLGDGAKSVLQKALGVCYCAGNRSPAASELLKELSTIPDKDRVRGWKLSAARALESLEFSGISGKGNHSQYEIAMALFKENTIIELDALSQGTKKFILPILCLWLYHMQLSSEKREKLALVIFLEEAHHILHKGHGNESVMEMLLRQCREIGIAIVVVDQHPHLISSAVLGNTYTSICLNLKDPADINKAAALSLVPDEERHFFSTLPVGQAIVKLQDRWRMPFLVQIPIVNLRKGAMTDALLKQYIEASETLSGFKSFIERKFVGIEHFRYEDYILNNEGALLINDIYEFPYDGVDVRYKRLRLSADKGTRLKDQLEYAGLVTGHVVRIGNTRRIVLRLTSRGKELLGFEEEVGEWGKRSAESMLHEFWKNAYAERFRMIGYKIEVEASRPRGIPGRVDVLATRAGESVAIEVETGKSDVVLNVKQDLRAGVGKVIVVATDKPALEKVERELARAGLLGVGKMDVVRAGEQCDLP